MTDLTVPRGSLRPSQKTLNRHSALIVELRDLIFSMKDEEWFSRPEELLNLIEVATDHSGRIHPGSRANARSILSSFPSGRKVLRLDNKLYTLTVLLKELYYS